MEYMDMEKVYDKVDKDIMWTILKDVWCEW